MTFALLFLAVGVSWRTVFWGPEAPLFGNILFLFHPLLHHSTEQLVQGSLPWWNPYSFCGTPLAADPQAGLFSPLHLPYRLFSWSAAFKIQLALSLGLLSVLTHCLARRLGHSRAGALLAGFLAACNGFVFYHGGMIPHLATLVCMPATLLFWISGAGALAGLSLSLQFLGGHPFFVYMTLVACLVLRPSPNLARTALWTAATALLLCAGPLIGAATLYSSAEQPGGMTPEAMYAYSFSADELWRQLGPLWNRIPENFVEDYMITSFYVGIPAAFLALCSAFHRRGGLLFLAVAGLGLSLGDKTPLYPALVKLLPGLGLFRYPAQWLGLSALGVSLLAGDGLRRVGARAGVFLAALAAADIIWFTALPPFERVAPEFYHASPAALRRRPFLAHERVAHEASFFAKSSDSEGIQRWTKLKDALAPSHASVFHLSETLSYNRYRPPRLAALFGSAPSAPLMRFAGITAFTTASGAAAAVPDDPMPRWSWVPSSRVMSFPSALEHLRSKRFNPEAEVLLESATETSGTGSATVISREETPRRLEAETSSDAAGYLVRAERYDQGWRAFIDGAAVPVLRANADFMAAPLDAGTHRAVFIYRPAAFEAGLLAGCCGLFLLAAGGSLLNWKSARH